jgi:uncharacterized protein YqhQ
MLKWYRLLSIVAFLLSFSIAFAEDINVTVNVTPAPQFGLVATARAIAQVNPLAPLVFVLMPIIIGEFLIRNFEEIRLNKPLEALIRMIVIITALALFAATFYI